MNRRVVIIIVVAAAIALAGGCSDNESPTNVEPGGDDMRAPEAIADPVLTYSAATGAVRLEWTAPHDDDPTERVAAYEIRYMVTHGYEPPEFWDLSTPISDPPDPLEPGSRQHYTFTDMRRARDLYVGIRSLDEGGNRSEASDLATVHIPGYSFEGRCVDVLTGEPLTGLDVALTSGTVFEYTTDGDGRFAHTNELDAGVSFVDIRTGSASDEYHSLRQPFILDRDTIHTFVMIPVRPVIADWTPNLLALFKHMSRTVTSNAQYDLASPQYSSMLAKWHKRPVACYVPPFVSDEGIDYAEQARSAAQKWMDRTGEPLFTFVDTPPDTGIVLTYKPSSSMGGIGFTLHTKGEDGHPILDEIRIINDIANPATVWLVFLHEFGHTIQLGHVSDRNFIMFVGQPLPTDLSEDEVDVVQLHEALPTRIDMAIYDEFTP